MAAARRSRVVNAAVAAVLARYAARGTLRPVDAAAGTRGTVHAFRWFRDREFRLHVDERAGCLRLDGVLDGVAPRSVLDHALRAWLRGRHDRALPAHRRIDTAHATLSLLNRGGKLSLRMRLHDGDWTRATCGLVHLVNELYLDVLPAGPHFEWLVETFDLDPENPRWP